jgi:hypothetical protein
MPSGDLLALGRVAEAGEVRRLGDVLDVDLDVGLTAWAPATKPASNFWMRSISTPPMKPMCRSRT